MCYALLYWTMNDISNFMWWGFRNSKSNLHQKQTTLSLYRGGNFAYVLLEIGQKVTAESKSPLIYGLKMFFLPKIWVIKNQQ